MQIRARIELRWNRYLCAATTDLGPSSGCHIPVAWQEALQSGNWTGIDAPPEHGRFVDRRSDEGKRYAGSILAADSTNPLANASISLRGRSEMPVVKGLAVPRLTPHEYDLVQLLIDAAPKLLEVGQFNQLLSRQNRAPIGDPSRTLRMLARKHQAWSDVLILPGQGRRGKGYGIKT